MRVFVAGAAGAVGRPLVRQLVARGHSVFATTRSSARASELGALGATPLQLDGLDPTGAMQAVSRAEPDVIIHEMTALSATPDLRHFDRWFAETNRLRTQGAAHLIAAAQATGVRRLHRAELYGLEQPARRPAPGHRGTTRSIPNLPTTSESHSRRSERLKPPCCGRRWRASWLAAELVDLARGLPTWPRRSVARARAHPPRVSRIAFRQPRRPA